jgi:phage gp36-like protein
MPLYLSIPGLVARHGTDFVLRSIVGDGDGRALDDEARASVLRAIGDAEARVNAHLRSRVTLPLAGVSDIEDPEGNANVPDVLRSLVADIAIYRLSAEADQLTTEKRKRYDDAIRFLESYAADKVTLGIEGAATATQQSVRLTTNERVLSRSETDGLL